MSVESTSALALENHLQQRSRRWEWLAQRCGMAMMAIIVLGALGGLFGSGPLSGRVSTSTDGRLSVEYDAVQRFQSPHALVINCPPPETGSGTIRLLLSRSFTDRIALESLTPEPEGVRLSDGSLIYRFRASDLMGKGRIVFRYKNDSYGSTRGTIDVEGSKVQVSAFVLP